MCVIFIVIIIVVTFGLVFGLKKRKYIQTSHKKLSEQFQNKNNKTLVILLGNARGGEDTWKTLYKNVLYPLKADLALLFDENYENNSLIQKAKYHWFHSLPDNLSDIYDDAAEKMNIDKNIWRQHAINNKETGLYGGCKLNIDNKLSKLIGSGAIIFYFRNILLKNYINILKKYDTIILTRSDHYYLCEHPNFDTSNGKIFIPKGEDYGGITDRHIVFNPQDSVKVLNIINYLVIGDKNKHFSNPEEALFYMFKDYGLESKINRFDRMMFTVKTKNDTTSWRTDDEFKKFNKDLLLKYPKEHEDSLITCNKNIPKSYFNMDKDKKQLKNIWPDRENNQWNLY